MIDLHSHILPGIDDGAKNWEESLTLARVYSAAGFTRIVATPHFVPGTRWKTAPETIKRLVSELGERLKGAGIAVTVFPGMEIAMDPAILTLLDNGLILPLNQSRYLLIEAPFDRLPLGWEQLLFDIQTRGHEILIAHPERCSQFMREPGLFDKMAAAGVFFQSNWDSFSGAYGPDCRRLFLHLAESGLVHCLATDSHNPRSRNASQTPGSSAQLEQIVGSENLALLCRENPLRVLRNQALTTMRPTEAGSAGRKKRRWWSR